MLNKYSVTVPRLYVERFSELLRDKSVAFRNLGPVGLDRHFLVEPATDAQELAMWRILYTSKMLGLVDD